MSMQAYSILRSMQFVIHLPNIRGVFICFMLIIFFVTLSFFLKELLSYLLVSISCGFLCFLRCLINIHAANVSYISKLKRSVNFHSKFEKSSSICKLYRQHFVIWIWLNWSSKFIIRASTTAALDVPNLKSRYRRKVLAHGRKLLSVPRHWQAVVIKFKQK